jgi:hypothetical protein
MQSPTKGDKDDLEEPGMESVFRKKNEIEGYDPLI